PSWFLSLKRLSMAQPPPHPNPPPQGGGSRFGVCGSAATEAPAPPPPLWGRVGVGGVSQRPRRYRRAMTSIFERDLDQGPANFVPLSPLSLLPRAARVWPDKIAVIHGDRRCSYRELHARVTRLASALARRGIGRGDTVAVMAPNIPPLLEA